MGRIFPLAQITGFSYFPGLAFDTPNGVERKKFQGFGAIAQLGERLNGIQEVVGSIPISSTIKSQGVRAIPPPSSYGI